MEYLDNQRNRDEVIDTALKPSSSRLGEFEDPEYLIKKMVSFMQYENNDAKNLQKELDDCQSEADSEISNLQTLVNELKSEIKQNGKINQPYYVWPKRFGVDVMSEANFKGSYLSRSEKGKNFKLVHADSIQHARLIGEFMRMREKKIG